MKPYWKLTVALSCIISNDIFCFPSMLYSIKCIMYANTSVGSLFINITLGSHELAWINLIFFELFELYFWPSRNGVDEHFPANVQQMLPSKVSSWMRQRFRYRGQHIVMSKDWRFGGWQTKCAKRIHVESIICCVKTFTILKKTLNSEHTHSGMAGSYLRASTNIIRG